MSGECKKAFPALCFGPGVQGFEIFPDRTKTIDHFAFGYCYCAVGYITRDMRSHTGCQNDGFALHSELQLSIEYMGPLFLQVMMLGQNGTFFQSDVTEGKIIGMGDGAVDTVPDFKMRDVVEVYNRHL